MGSSEAEGGDAEVADHTWVPEIVEEESEGEAEQQQGSVSTRGNLQRTGRSSDFIPMDVTVP